jgi:tetratricopeptide (TPR) repeat protein
MAKTSDPSKVPFREPNRSSAPVLIPVTAEDVARERRRKVTMWVVAVLVTVGAAAWIYKRSTDPLKAQESFEAGRRLAAVARYPQAILSFDRAIQLEPDFGEAYLLRARARVALYDQVNALADFNHAIQLKPRDSMALLDRGRVYLMLERYSEAIADATLAVAIEPKLAAAYNLRGTAIRASGDTARALKDFEMAVQYAPDADNYFQRGATYQALGEHQHAIEDFDRTIDFAPD